MRLPFGEHVLLFNKKKIVLRARQKMPKCPPFRHYEQLNHVKSFLNEIFWEVSVQTIRPVDVVTFSCPSLDFGGKIGHLRT